MKHAPPGPYDLPSASKLRIILVVLLTSSLSWIALSHLNGQMTATTLAAAGAAFVGMWTIMMAGMMLPSAIPAVMLFDTTVQARRRLGVRPAPTWVFVMGYLVVWSIVGLLIFAGSKALQHLVPAPDGTLWNDRKIVAALFLAGLYQFTGWKSAYLNHCRSPLLVLTPIWRDGFVGALRMGAAYGRYCVGCCGGLMVVLLAVGMLNFWWAAVLAGVVLVEKVAGFGARFSRAAGAVLIAGGFLLAMV